MRRGRHSDITDYCIFIFNSCTWLYSPEIELLINCFIYFLFVCICRYTRHSRWYSSPQKLTNCRLQFKSNTQIASWLFAAEKFDYIRFKWHVIDISSSWFWMVSTTITVLSFCFVLELNELLYLFDYRVISLCVSVCLIKLIESTNNIYYILFYYIILYRKIIMLMWETLNIS